MEKSEAAAYLAGAKQVEGAEASAPTNLHVISGEVVEKSENGKVKVDLGGIVFNGDDDQHIEIDTLGGLEVGDTATILLSGQEHRGMTPLGVGGVGTVDRIVERVSSIEADYVKTAVLEAQIANIDTLIADKADVDDLTAATARINSLETTSAKVEDLVAATARIGRLEVDHVSVEEFTAEQAKITNLQTATADIDTIRANSAKVTNLTAQELEADHATVGQLDATYATIGSLNAEQIRVDNLLAAKASVTDLTAASARIDNLESTKADISILESDYITADAIEATYMHANMSNSDVAWIQNGVIKDGSISNAMINSVSANKLTAGTINGEVINVTNLNASNITTGTINGQRIGEGSLSLSKLEEDVYTEQEIDSKLSTMQAEIDGAIETWTGTDVPTLNNSPASNWTTDDVRDTHVGDVYFVVNSQSEQNGYNYRFTKSGNTYSWQLIKDSDVTNALQRISTAEGKITTFDSDISKLKTDTGTLTTKTESLETRMSDAESDILDKVDTTTFNEVSDTVDQHSQTITQMSQTISNKADGSTVTSLTQRVSKNEQDITGINTTIGELSTTVESKADSSTVETVSSRLNTVSNTVDGHTQSITSITSTQTTMQATLDKTLVETTQLWFSKANTTAPSKPTAQVTSTSTAGNAWRTVVPAYNSSYPNYFYCYQWKYSDGTYGWSSVTRDIAMGEAQSTSRTADSNASTALSTANTADSNATTALNTANTADGNASTALSTANTANGNATTALSTANTAKETADKNVKSTTQLWYTKANDTAPSKPTSKVTSTAVSGNGWRTVVPTYSSSYPYYFYCMQYELADGTYTWSDVVYDRATTENQSNSRSAVSGVSTLTTKTNTISDTVDGHTSQLTSITETQTTIQGSAVKSTVQLWFTKANTTAPSKPTTHITTNNASTANAWNLAVPTYNSSYPYYYYCYEHQLLNDTYTWSAVTRDIATEESQSTSRSAQATADKNVRESQQLWYTKANSTAPAKPTSKVTSTATTGGAWTTRVPTYSDSYKYYFYCMQYVAADGTVTWSDVVYDQATTEAQSVARAASADLTEFHQEYATFKQTTQQFESTVGETYATKTALEATDGNVSRLTTRVSTAETNITQNTKDIALRATKTEASQMAQPNLTPWFSITVNDTSYWSSLHCRNTSFTNAEGLHGIWDREEGWAHITLDARTSAGNDGSKSCYMNMHVAKGQIQKMVKPEGKYTWLVEVRNLTWVGASSSSRLYVLPSVNNATMDVFSTMPNKDAPDGGKFNADGTAYGVVTAKSDFSSLTIDTRGYCYVTTGCYADFDLRISLYEGEYTGPYKPYVGSQLYASQAELKVTNDSISSKVSTTDYNGQTIASLINQSADSVVIEAEHIELNGTTVFNTIKSSLDSNYDAKGAAQTVQNNLDNLEIGGRNLLKASDVVHTPTTYNAYDLYLTEPIEDGVPYVLQLWDVDVSHTGKTAATLGVNAYYCGGSVTFGGWIGTNYFTDGHADHLELRFTAYTSGATVSSGGSVNPSPTNALAHNTVVNVTKKYIRLYNSVPSADGTRSLTVGKWKLEKGNKATDWTPAPEDLASATDSVEYIAGTQTAATGSWTGITRDSSLVAGKTIAYKLPYAGSGSASLQLKDSSGNNVGGNIAVYSMTTRVTTHYPAGSVIQMTYDGTYWRTAGWYNSNNYDRNLHNNYVKAAANVASGQMVCGTSAGYKPIAASVTFDMSYPILWAGGAWTSGTQYANAYETYPSVNPATTAAVQGIAVNKMVYVKGTISGNTFTCAASNFLTCTVPTSEDGYFYLPVGIVANDATTKMYFNTSNDLYAYLDGKFRQVTPTEIVASHRIYWRSAASTKPDAPTTWISEATQNTYDAWTTKIPPLSLDKASSTATKYLYLYTCEQRKRLDGTTQCTAVQLDENTTVIDGGNIITNSITAEKIQANSLTLGQIKTDVQKDILNSNVQVGGRNLLLGSADYSTKSGTNQTGISVSSDTHGGTRILVGTWSSGNMDMGRFLNAFSVSLRPDADYTLSFWGKATASINVVSYLFTPSTVTSGANSSGNTTTSTDGAIITKLGTEWERYWVTWHTSTADSQATQIIAARVSGSGASGTTVYIAGIKFELGNKATDWTPAPEDQTAYVDGSVDGVQKSVSEITGTVTEMGADLATQTGYVTELQNNMTEVQDKVAGLEGVTSCLSFNTKDGLIIADKSAGDSYFYTQQKGSFMSFNQTSASGDTTLMTLSGTNGIEGPKATVDEVVSPYVHSGNWAISMDEDTFSIDYIGN